MKIKEIFDEIATTGGNNAKMDVLRKYVDNELLKRVLYMSNSKKVKFFIKRIPEYTKVMNTISLSEALGELEAISNREVTGSDALNLLVDILSLCESDDAYIIERIIDKDCKIGMGTTFMNKVFKGLIEETPYMGAVSFDEKKARKIFDKGGKGISQVKMDGRYCNAVIRGGEVELESRQGEPTIVTGAKFADELAQLDDCVLNGELTMDGIPRYESNGIIASIIDISKNKSERTDKENEKKLAAFEEKHGNFDEALGKIRYTVWDRITIDEYFDTKSATPYSKRAIELNKTLKSIETSHVSIVEGKVVNSYEDAISHFQDILGRGDEGTILKAYDGEWKDGKPTWQIKMKLELTLDLVITGFNYGTKGTKNENVVSSFNAETSCGKLKTRPQGLTEALMTEITENQENLLGTIIEVKCSGLSFDHTGAYSLLYPAFKHFRDDKLEANSLDECIEIQNSAIGLTV
jgi:ATP-dependent DNA ligase